MHNTSKFFRIGTNFIILFSGRGHAGGVLWGGRGENVPCKFTKAFCRGEKWLCKFTKAFHKVEK